MRIYAATSLVLAMLLASPKDAMYPHQISKITGLTSGTVAPILRRLADHGWCTSWWENPDGGASLGRPLRRYYLLTTTGAYLAEAALRKKLGPPRG